MDSAIAVTGRQSPRQVEQLAMRGDDKELAWPLQAGKSDTHWIAGTGHWSGLARRLEGGELSAEAEQVSQSGTASLVLTDGRLIGIVSPESVSQAAVWFAVPLGELQIAALGSQGTFKKRPAKIEVIAPAWKLEISDVGQFWIHTRRLTPSQENGFMKASSHA